MCTALLVFAIVCITPCRATDVEFKVHDSIARFELELFYLAGAEDTLQTPQKQTHTHTQLEIAGMAS